MGENREFMGIRSATVNFCLPLLAFLFFACTESTPTHAPKPYYPERGYRHVEENIWHDYNKGRMPTIPELSSEKLTWRDAIAYNGGEFLALSADRSSGQESPKVVHIYVNQNTRLVFGEEFPRRFRRISLDVQDYGIDGPEEELGLIMQYGNKESIVVINARTMTPVFWYESDDISVVNQNDGKIITGVSFESGRPIIEAYRWDGQNYVKTQVPQEINLTDKMAESIEQNKNELISATLSNPQEAVRKTQQLLGTDNPLLVSTALQFATRDVYVVDEKESKPLWQYLVEYDVKPGEARARVAVDPLVAYVALNKIGIGQTPLPWADNESLAVVVATQLSKEKGNTYLNLRLTRDERGEFKLEGDLEPGERLIKISETVQTYVPVAKEEADKIQRDLGSGLSQGRENLKQFLEERDKITKEKQQESQRRTEELKQTIGEELKKGQRELQQQQEKTKEEVRRKSEELQKQAEEQKKKLEEAAENARREAERKAQEAIDKAKQGIEDLFKKKK